VVEEEDVEDADSMPTEDLSLDHVVGLQKEKVYLQTIVPAV